MNPDYEKILSRIEISKKENLKDDPNRFNCAGFIVAVLTGKKEIRYMTDGTDMAGFLRTHEDTGSSDFYEIDRAANANFIAIGYHKAFDGDEFIQYFHFAVIDKNDPTKLFQRNGTGGAVEHSSAQDLIGEYLIERPWRDIVLKPKIHYFK